MKMLHVLFVMVIVAVTACGGSDSDGTKSLTTALLITDKFDQKANSFVVGDDVVVTAKISNPSNIVRSIKFTAPLITIQILSEDAATLIFDPDFGLSFPQFVTVVLIDPFGEITRTLTWNGTDNVGAQVAPRMYQVVVRIQGVAGAQPIQHNDLIQLL